MRYALCRLLAATVSPPDPISDEQSAALLRDWLLKDSLHHWCNFVTNEGAPFTDDCSEEQLSIIRDVVFDSKFWDDGKMPSVRYQIDNPKEFYSAFSVDDLDSKKLERLINTQVDDDVQLIVVLYTNHIDILNKNRPK